MVGEEATTNQRKNLDKFTTPNNNINRCLFGRLGDVLPRSKEKSTLDIPGEERSYKCFGTEGSKKCNFNFFSFTSQSSINTLSNEQYCWPFIFGKNGRYLKQISDYFEQGNMGLFAEQRNHNYCRISPRVTQCGGRCSVQDSNGCKRVEVKSKYIPKDLETQGNTGDRSFCFSNLTAITHLHFMKTGLLQPMQRCFPTFLDQQEEICLSPFCLIGWVLKKFNWTKQH